MAADGSPLGQIKPQDSDIAPSRERTDGRVASATTRGQGIEPPTSDLDDLDIAFERLDRLLADGQEPAPEQAPRGYFLNILV